MSVATEAEIDRAVQTLQQRLSGDPIDLWPKRTPGGFYPPEEAMRDLLEWIRADDQNSYRGFRSRIRKLIIDKDCWMVDQFEATLQLPPGFIDRIRNTGHNDSERPSLRQDFIRHLLTLP